MSKYPTPIDVPQLSRAEIWFHNLSPWTKRAVAASAAVVGGAVLWNYAADDTSRAHRSREHAEVVAPAIKKDTKSYGIDSAEGPILCWGEPVTVLEPGGNVSQVVDDEVTIRRDAVSGRTPDLAPIVAKILEINEIEDPEAAQPGELTIFEECEFVSPR